MSRADGRHEDREEVRRKKEEVRTDFNLDFGERRKRTSWRSSERREIRESRIELYKKTGNFLNGRRDARLRHSSFCGAFSVVMFSVGLFPVPLVRCDFWRVRHSYCRRRPSQTERRRGNGI